MISNTNLLEIMSPSPFSRYYGINDEVYRMQRAIEKNIDVTKYSTIIHTISIGPIIAPPEDQFIKEIKNVSKAYGYATIRLYSDFDEYLAADDNKKKEIILENIFRSLKYVRKRVGPDFDYNRLCSDILKLVSVDQINDFSTK